MNLAQRAALLYTVGLRPRSSDYPTSQNTTWFLAGQFSSSLDPLLILDQPPAIVQNIQLFVYRDASRSFYDKHRDDIVSSDVNASTTDIPADHWAIGRQFRMQVTTTEDTPTYAHEAGK